MNLLKIMTRWLWLRHIMLCSHRTLQSMTVASSGLKYTYCSDCKAMFSLEGELIGRVTKMEGLW
jgi:hypothetical protein